MEWGKSNGGALGGFTYLYINGAPPPDEIFSQQIRSLKTRPNFVQVQIEYKITTIPIVIAKGTNNT